MILTYTFNKQELIDRYMGEIEIIKECINIFIESVEEKLTLISDAIETKDFEKIRFNAHSIKGASYNMSVKELGDIALNLEKACKEYDIESIKNYYLSLKENFLKVKEILLNCEF